MPKAVERYVDDDEEAGKPNKDEAAGEEYVAVEDDPAKGKEGKEEADPDSDEDDDDTDADGNKSEQRLGGGRDDDEDDKTRKANENKTRRQRQREARDRTERELKFLQKRNEDLERRFSTLEQNTEARVTGNEVANLTNQINKARSDLQLANSVIAQAADQNNGAQLAEALDHRDSIRDNLRDLQEAHRYLTQREERGESAQPRQLDPRHVAHAQKFMTDHSWWDPSGTDQDSRRVLEVDRGLVAEGYDPVSKDYWDELRARVKEAVPKRFSKSHQDDDDDDEDNIGNRRDTKGGNGKPKNKGPQFRTGGRERPLKKNEVYISPERRSAMEEAGVWDDPVLRNKYLKSYAKYDREQQGQGA